MKAFVKNYRQSPSKVRLVAQLVNDKKPAEAVNILRFTPRRAAVAVSKAIQSAVANAVNNFSVDEETLRIDSIRVDEGTTMHRWRPRFGGRATPIRKRSSHISVSLRSTDAIKKTPVAKTTTATADKTPKVAELPSNDHTVTTGHHEHPSAKSANIPKPKTQNTKSVKDFSHRKK